MSEAHNEVEAEQVGAGGTRMRRAFMSRLMMTREQITTMVLPKGIGARVHVGRFIGVATGLKEKFNTLPDGRQSRSVMLEGIFESQNELTGEVTQYTQAYLPMAFAESVEAAFKMNPDATSIQMDIDIGVEVTGKSIPYEWTVTSHIKGEASNILADLRQRRVIALPGRSAPAQIEGTATEVTDDKTVAKGKKTA